jgi:hypothetical protein
LNPQVSDDEFKIATRKAVISVFPSIDVAGCHMNLGQSMYRNFSSKGLLKIMKNFIIILGYSCCQVEKNNGAELIRRSIDAALS